jgi:hypothetical protein
MEVKSCKVDNEKSIRDQERKNKLNDQLIQRLNQLQKERNKEMLKA